MKKLTVLVEYRYSGEKKIEVTVSQFKRMMNEPGLISFEILEGEELLK